jgi:hypothetical protein
LLALTPTGLVNKTINKTINFQCTPDAEFVLAFPAFKAEYCYFAFGFKKKVAFNDPLTLV